MKAATGCARGHREKPSVRETETLVKRLDHPAPAGRAVTPVDACPRGRGPAQTVLGTRVRIIRRGKGGKIEVDFGSEDELQVLRVSDEPVGFRAQDSGLMASQAA
jgi:hypothetical protein